MVTNKVTTKTLNWQWRFSQAIVLLTIWLALSVTSAVAGKRQGVRSEFNNTLAAKIARIAPQYGLDPQLVLAIMRQESRFRTDARSPKNARGLMQFIPTTAASYGISDPHDPEQAINGGCRYLVKLIKQYQGRVDLVLAAYNAGEGNVAKYGGIPPFNETKLYVLAVLSNYQRARAITALKGPPGKFMGRKVNIMKGSYGIMPVAHSEISEVSKNEKIKFGVQPDR
jgi:soluble lytic murein transglycosylase-like protein